MILSGNFNQLRQARVAGHFGEWLQGRLGPKGPIALVSVQCPTYWAQARLQSHDNGLSLDSLIVTENQIIDLAHALGVQVGGDIQVTGNMPLGAGLGGSTAALLAAAKVLAPNAGESVWIDACLSVEGASDPLAFPHFDQVIWASRKAQIIGQTDPLPKFDVVGGLWGNGQKTDPNDNDFADISQLLTDWQSAVAAGSCAQCAEIATESARLCVDARGPSDDPSFDIAKETGALGVIHAHTGSARGVLFPAGQIPDVALSVMAEAGYSQVTTFQTGGPA